ncbi:MAG: transcriptional repressor [Acetatifactor sp.]|nr:transcriptional repressor [Acetatifactor sp.]
MDKKVRSAARAAVYGEKWGSEYPQGIKWTKQRKSVYKVLKDASEPLSAAQIYRLAGEESAAGDYAGGRDYALSTVYRILAAFEEKKLVEKNICLEDGTVVYSLARNGHTHYAVCLGCHRRIPLQSCPFNHIHMEKEPEGFTVTGHRLELYGYCVECGKNEDW